MVVSLSATTVAAAIFATCRELAQAALRSAQQASVGWKPYEGRPSRTVCEGPRLKCRGLLTFL